MRRNCYKTPPKKAFSIAQTLITCIITSFFLFPDMKHVRWAQRFTECHRQVATKILEESLKGIVDWYFSEAKWARDTRDALTVDCKWVLTQGLISSLSSSHGYHQTGWFDAWYENTSWTAKTERKIGKSTSYLTICVRAVKWRFWKRKKKKKSCLLLH